MDDGFVGWERLDGWLVGLLVFGGLLGPVVSSATHMRVGSCSCVVSPRLHTSHITNQHTTLNNVDIGPYFLL